MIESSPGAMPLLRGGAPLKMARHVLIMLHGRGGNQKKTAQFADRCIPRDVALLVPGSATGPWWPHRHDRPVAADDPYLMSALMAVEGAVQEALDAGFEPSEIVVSGFSMGAALALEHVARTGRHYRGVVAMTGALLGTLGPGPQMLPEGEPGRYTVDLTGIPIVVTTHSWDLQVPAPFVAATVNILRARGAKVTAHIEPGQEHSRTATDEAFIAQALSDEGLPDPVDETPMSTDIDEKMMTRLLRKAGALGPSGGGGGRGRGGGGGGRGRGGGGRGGGGGGRGGGGFGRL